MDCSPAGSSVHGILQARILECIAISSSRRSSHLGILPESLKFPALAGWFFTAEPPGKPSRIPSINFQFYCQEGSWTGGFLNLRIPSFFFVFFLRWEGTLRVGYRTDRWHSASIFWSISDMWGPGSGTESLSDIEKEPCTDLGPQP